MELRSRRPDLGLLALRLGVGSTLAAHGAQKLFGWFGGGGIEGTAAGMEAMGFHPSRQSAVLAGLGETGDGILLALGLATPVGGAAAASTMVAAGAVHRPAGFFATKGGYEYTGVLGLAGTALAIAGPLLGRPPAGRPVQPAVDGHHGAGPAGRRGGRGRRPARAGDRRDRRRAGRRPCRRELRGHRRLRERPGARRERVGHWQG